MCNHYRLRKSAADVARHFQQELVDAGNFAADVFPGYTGLVIGTDGLRTMTWGFPLVMTSRKTGKPLKPKPVNNAREDKLRTPFWRDSFVHRRCLIPISAWAEADGEKGHMTRTWYALPDQDVFAVAGIWRDTQEWGAAYSMVMVDSPPAIAAVNDRMPTILTPETAQTWLHGSPEAAFAVCQTWTGPLHVDATQERWGQATALPVQTSLF